MNKKKRNKNKLKQERGITLIALVVTIIILIILATISVNMIFSDNGLIATAKGAREHQANATVSEQGELDRVAEDAANILAGGSGEGTTKEPWEPNLPASGVGSKIDKPNTWTSERVIPINNGEETAIPLPEKFYYVGGDITSGLVISDKEGDTMDAVFPDSGNQFVWIPVKGEADLERTKFDTTTGKPTTGLDTTIYIEPYTSGYSDGKGTQEIADFNTMKTQVLKYGGFYIGRYEVGDADSGTTLRSKVTTDHTMVSKKGVAPYNFLPWGKSMSDVDTAFAPDLSNPDNVETHGAVYLARNMYKNSESVVSTLCYSSQWDAMCRYIGDNNRKPATNSKPELTGSVDSDVSKNIYDLAGNCREWTMEATPNRRACRGGVYTSSNPVSVRVSNYPDCTNDFLCLRSTLYIR